MENKELNITIPKTLTKPHKLTTATKEYHKNIKSILKNGGWSHQVDKTDVLSISVSENLFSRGLKFIDTLVKIFEKRGYIIEGGEKTKNYLTLNLFFIQQLGGINQNILENI